MKKVLSWVIVIVLVASIFPQITLPAMAALNDETQSWTGKLNSTSDVETFAFELKNSARVSFSFDHAYIDWGHRDLWNIKILSSTELLYEFFSWTDTASIKTVQMFLPADKYQIRVSAGGYMDGALNDFSLAVTGFNGEMQLDYSVSVNYAYNDGTFEVENNDDQSHATQITVNKPIMGALQGEKAETGYLQSFDTNDVDWFTFELKSECEVSLTFEHDFVDWGERDLWRIQLLSNDEILTFKSYATKMVTSSEVKKLSAGTYYINIKKGGYCTYPGSFMPYILTVNAEGEITPLTTNPLDSASTWAKESITAAIGKGFVPSEIQGSYTNVITRAEFCRMAIKWVEYATGKNIDAILTEKGLSRRQNAFNDTTDPDILAAYALGITNGTVAPTATTPGTFTPNGQFNREQAATMIMNTCRAIGANVTNPPVSDFTDLNTASSWARDGINFVRANGIMQGTSANPPMFSPKSTYTREQSIVTFNNIKHNELPRASGNAAQNLPKPIITAVTTSPFTVSGTYEYGIDKIVVIITSLNGDISYIYGNDGIPQEIGGGSFKYTNALSSLSAGDYAVFVRGYSKDGLEIDSGINQFTLETVGAPPYVLDWINNSKGKTYGNGQCVIYINAYLTEFWGMTTAGKIWSAYEIFDDNKMTFPTGWQKISYYDGFVPQPGDIAVWGAGWYSGSVDGHVAIVVDGSTANQVVVYDQYSSSGGVIRNPYAHANRKNFLGVIRPAY